MMLTLFGDADRLKSGAAFTVRLTVVVCVRLPEVPVIVTVLVPAAAVLLAANVSELVVVVEAGVKVAVTPLGRPDAVKATLPVNPFLGVTVIVSALLALPWTTVKVVADPAMPKSGAAAAGVSVYIAVYPSPLGNEPEHPVR